MVEFRRGGIGTKSDGGPTEVVPSQAHTFPRPGEQVVPERDPRRRENRYAGFCTNGCGVKVQAGEGYLSKTASGAWGAEHIVCPTAEAPVSDEAALQVASFTQTTVNGQVVFDGIYTLQSDLFDHRTFRLKTQGRDEDFMPGVQILEFLSGPDNDHDYLRFGHVKNGRPVVWKRFKDNADLNRDINAFFADPHGEGVLASVNCYRCGRTLTVPTSVHNGLGPECAKRGF